MTRTARAWAPRHEEQVRRLLAFLYPGVAAKAVRKRHKSSPALAAELAPLQLAVGVRGGCESAARYQELLSFDIKNCFNAVSRARLFRELAARPKLRQLLLLARLQRRRRGRRRGGRGGSRGGVRRRGGDSVRWGPPSPPWRCSPASTAASPSPTISRWRCSPATVQRCLGTPVEQRGQLYLGTPLGTDEFRRAWLSGAHLAGMRRRPRTHGRATTAHRSCESVTVSRPSPSSFTAASTAPSIHSSPRARRRPA